MGFSGTKPAVLWAQYLESRDRLVMLGGMQGHSMILELFAPAVLGVARAPLRVLRSAILRRVH